MWEKPPPADPIPQAEPPIGAAVGDLLRETSHLLREGCVRARERARERKKQAHVKSLAGLKPSCGTRFPGKESKKQVCALENQIRRRLVCPPGGDKNALSLKLLLYCAGCIHPGG